MYNPYNDKLDLLGVRYDAELEMRAMYEMAEEVASYWIKNGYDEDFYKNCMEDICRRLGHENGPVPQEAKDIWKIIAKEYLI